MKRVEKPWGYEFIWAQTDNYVGKIIHINSGHKLSRQYHNVKEETFYVKSGSMTLEIGPPDNFQLYVMVEGDVYHCPPNTIHRMVADCGSSVDVIEVSTNHLDDVVRLEDDYGR